MAWSRIRTGWDFVKNNADYYLTPLTRFADQHLTAIAKAVYESQPVSHFQQGFNQIFRVPAFLNYANRTRDLVKCAINTNLLNYLIPVILYRRAVNVCHEKLPDFLNNVIIAADWAITLTLVMRLFVRRLTDNSAYTLCLPRVISNDVAEHLPRMIAEGLAHELSGLFEKIFFQAVRDNHHFDEQLRPRLLEIFTVFFSKSEINKNTFQELIKPLEKLFLELIEQQDFLSVTPQFIKNFSEQLAITIANEFAQTFSIENQFTVKKDYESLNHIIATSFEMKLAGEHSQNLERSISRVHENVRAFLPAKYNKSCACETKKIVSAGISSPVYYSGILALTYLPDLLNWLEWISPSKYFYSRLFACIMRIMLYGQSMNEYKVAAEGQCTRHRYQVFARNKAYGLGVGAAYVLTVEALANLFYFTTNVDSFFTRDAISNLMMEMGIIATLAYNDPLPGKQKRPWDIFYLPRKIVRWGVDTVTWLFIPDINDSDARDDLMKNVKRIISSKKLYQSVDLLFGDGDFYPQNKSKDVESKQVAVKMIEFRNEDDVLNIIFNFPSIKKMLKLYNHDFELKIARVEQLHHVAIWTAGPLLSRPVQGFVASVLILPLKVLKEDSLPLLFDKIRKGLLEARIWSENNGNNEVVLVRPTTNIPPPKSPRIEEFKRKPESTTLLIENKLSHNSIKSTASSASCITASDSKIVNPLEEEIAKAINEPLMPIARPVSPIQRNSAPFVSVVERADADYQIIDIVLPQKVSPAASKKIFNGLLVYGVSQISALRRKVNKKINGKPKHKEDNANVFELRSFR